MSIEYVVPGSFVADKSDAVFRIARIEGTVQNYDWGDKTSIAHILGRAADRPEAEYWLGAHPKAPSQVQFSGDRGQRLDLLLAKHPELLGSDVGSEFGELPYLLKILAAEKPLSIQVHPNRRQAEIGFERESNAGVALDDPKRNYVDRNHKPELICALTPMQAKNGFRSVKATVDLLEVLLDSGATALTPLHSILSPSGDEETVLKTALKYLLTMETAQRETLVASCVAAAEGAESERFANELFWTVVLNGHFPGDVGVVVALLLNHVHLQPGDALFLEAGNLHSYLRGAGIELMATGDNVVRCGLTSKHVDPEELARIVSTMPITPAVQRADKAVHRFSSPTPEFSLTRISLDSVSGTASFQSGRPEILLVTQGAVEIRYRGSERPLTLRTGEAVFVGATAGGYELCLAPGSDNAVEDTLIWRASPGGH